MSFGVSQRELERLRAMYQPGTIVELIFMDDRHAPSVGTKGKVTGVDDAGQVHVNWENGSSLALIPGVDAVRICEK